MVELEKPNFNLGAFVGTFKTLDMQRQELSDLVTNFGKEAEILEGAANYLFEMFA